MWRDVQLNDGYEAKWRVAVIKIAAKQMLTQKKIVEEHWKYFKNTFKSEIPSRDETQLWAEWQSDRRVKQICAFITEGKPPVRFQGLLLMIHIYY